MTSVTIGRCAIVATNAVVKKDVPNNDVAKGGPAKRFLKNRPLLNTVDKIKGY